MILFSPLIKILLGFPIKKKRKKRILLGFFFYVADIQSQVPYLTTNCINLSSFYQAFFYKINFPSKLLGYTHQRPLLSLPKFLLFFVFVDEQKNFISNRQKNYKKNRVLNKRKLQTRRTVTNTNPPKISPNYNAGLSYNKAKKIPP